MNNNREQEPAAEIARPPGVGTSSETGTAARSGQAITREDLALLPIRKYEGRVHVPASAAEIEEMLRDLRHEHVVGFDTETRPAFQKGQFYLPSLDQFASARAVYLLRPQHHDVADAIAEVLANGLIVKTGVAVVDDLRKLRELMPFTERNVIDLGDVAKRKGIAQSGVRNLVGLFLGWRVTKGSRTTNWARPLLSSSQITYAATDAWACRELYLHFQRLGWLGPVHG